MGAGEMPLKHLGFDATIEADDVFRIDATPDRHGWLGLCELRLTKRSQRLVHLRNNCRDVTRSNAVLAQIRGNDLCDLFFHEIAPYLSSRECPAFVSWSTYLVERAVLPISG
jgi:hypothetical protein